MCRTSLFFILILITQPVLEAGETIRVDPEVMSELEQRGMTTVIVEFDSPELDRMSVARTLGLASGIRVLQISRYHPEISARISKRGLKELLRHVRVRAIHRPVELLPAMSGGHSLESVELAATRRY